MQNTVDFPLYLIPLLPLIGASLSLLIGRRMGKNFTTLVACGSVAAAGIVAFKGFWMLREMEEARHTAGSGIAVYRALTSSFFGASWMKAGDLNISASLVLDQLSAILCLVVTGIGFLIHVYSTAYMEHDKDYTRFFGYLNLFTGAMLILVLGDSLPVTFVGWEGVGLCSYLLIGFWFDKDANALAGRKAFVVNRIGDLGFLLAMFLIFAKTGTLKYAELGKFTNELHAPMWWGLNAAFFIGMLILLGATGKSAQIPLYVWLPDAMAGPTPVSALIHAATMVTAGVYVVARMHFVFELYPATLAWVAGIGAATALFAATIGIAQRDMKKVLAYSTISQLGFMFVGVGSFVGTSANYQAGIFHLVTHAFFKAGLFLGAGSVMHALGGEGDIMRMGGLKKWLPHTRATFLIYCLAIAGIFPFAGFWSKDSILGGVFEAGWPASEGAGKLELFFANNAGHILYAVLLLAAACTAFYMFRLYFLVFEGQYRGPAPEADAHGSDAHGGHAPASDTHASHGHDDHGHGGLPHESPPAMTVVLWILAAGSLLVGFLGVPDAALGGAVHNRFGEWLDPVLPALAVEESMGTFWLFAGIAMVASLLAIGLAYMLYKDGPSPAVKRFVARYPGLYKLVFNKYYIDELYDLIVVRPFRAVALILWKAVDTFVIDLLLVNGVGFVVSGVGKLVKYFQNGDLQRYIVALLIGGAAILWVATRWDVDSAAKFDARVNDHQVDVTAHGAGPTAKRIQYKIDWGDGGKMGAAQQTPTFTHVYETSGKKKIVIEALDPRWNTVAHEKHTVDVK